MRNVKRWNRQRSPKVKSGATQNALAADYGLIVLNGPSTNSLNGVGAVSVNYAHETKRYCFPDREKGKEKCPVK